MKNTFLFLNIFCSFLFVSLVAFSKNSNLVNDIYAKTNQFRRSHGLPALIIRPELNSIAQKHSSDMARGRAPFGHSGFAQRNAKANKKIRSLHYFAENVAFGATSGNEVVTMWENSPGHRRNLLGHYKYVGIGIAKDRKGRIYYTEFFAG